MFSSIATDHRLRALLLAALLLLSCQIGSPEPAPTGTASPAGSPTETRAPTNSPSAATAATPAAESPTPQTPLTEIALADGTVALVPALEPHDYYDLFRSGVKDGAWTETEGILTLLRLIAGELDEADVPGAGRVENRMGTGVVHHAHDLLEDPDTPTETAAEIERLLALISPDRAALDAVSLSAEAFNAPPGGLARPAAQDQSCEDLESQGFSPEDVQPGTVCFIFILLQMEGQDYRVYYPVEWEEDEARKAWVDRALDAIIDTIPVYAGLGEVRPAHIIFSQRTEFSESREDAAGTQIPASFESDCAVAMYGISESLGPDVFKQMVAHELFHCFQDWNLFKKPYSQHFWWGEGSAQYFSNVVYPGVNFEHRAVDSFNVRSLNDSLMEMSYENFIFFQHLANHIGNQGLVDLLEEMSFKGGSDAHAAYLADISYMPGLFQDLFVTFASTGVPDSGGGVIAPEEGVAVREKRPIDDEGDFAFEAEPWVGARYGLSYDEEKRFVQEAEEDGVGNYGIVEAKLRRDRSAWSSLPEEVRSSCDEDSPYLLITTIVKNSYTITAAVSKVEVAECDPCLLGAWDMDLASFEGYMQGVFESLGEGGFEMEISGHYYLTFLEEGRATSLRNDLTVRIPYEDPNADPSEAGQTLAVVINAHGEGTYTADGEVLTVLTWLEVTDNSTAYIGDGQVVVQLDGGMVNTSLFGQSGSAEVEIGPSAEESANETAPYTCSNTTLEITRPEGTVRFLRIEEIPPTAVPTEFPEGNPDP
jgi:hypothetical protein